MADVNPNQDYRFKEIMKRMIPASYFLVLVYVAKHVFECEFYDWVPKMDEVFQTLSSNVLYGMLALVVVYVIGFVMNNLASDIERCLYRWGLSRPSKLTLAKNARLGEDEVKTIVVDSKIQVPSFDTICQEQAKKIFYFAKDHISRKDNLVEDVYYQSIIARNLLMAHFFAILSVFLLDGVVGKMLSEWFFIFAILGIAFVLWREWRRKNKLYAHNVFVEYLKEKKSKAKDSQKENE